MRRIPVIVLVMSVLQSADCEWVSNGLKPGTSTALYR